MVSNHPVKFGGNRHGDSRDMMFLVPEEQDSTFPRINPPLLFISKSYSMLC